MGYKLGFSISENVFDQGLSIAHYGTIIVNPSVKVGKNCRIHAGVNIGASVDGKSPMIGDNVYIGPGAKIFGGIILGNNIAVGANAVVNKSFPLGNCTIGGIPAHIISEKDSRLLAVTYYWKLQIYCKLCDPEEAYLLSSAGLGSLDKVLNIIHREDLLDFGNGKRIKKIKVAKWDVARGTIDHHSIIPKL